MPEVAEMLTRTSVPALDAVLGKVFPTYDKGFSANGLIVHNSSTNIALPWTA